MQVLKLIFIVMAATSLSYAQEISITSETVSVDGYKLHFRTAGNGPVILMLHGFTLSSEQWLEFFDDFAPHHRVIAVDLPGHGKSDSIEETEIFDSWADLMFKFLDKMNIDTLTGMGHSAGTMTLLKMAERSPERFNSLVLVAGGHAFSQASIELLLDDSFDKADEGLQNYYRRIHFGDMERIDRIFEDVRNMAHHFKQLEGNRMLSLQSLQKMNIPILLVFGDRDFYFPVEVATELYSLLPNAKLWIVPGSGHTPVWTNFGADKKIASRFAELSLNFISSN